MRYKALLVMVLLSVGLILSVAMPGHAEGGFIWSEEPGAAATEPGAAATEPVSHTITSDPLYVAGEGADCLCCEHCPICYDQATGERTSASCLCVVDGVYQGCGCECPFPINITQADFVEKLNQSIQIYDADGNVLTDRATWLQTYRDAVAPEGQPLALGEGEDVVGYLENYGEITGLSQDGTVYVDCGGACHEGLPMTMNAIMPLSSQGPRWYNGTHGKGWICYDWADVVKVLTSTAAAPNKGSAEPSAERTRWHFKDGNGVYNRIAYMAADMTATANSVITMAADSGKMQIKGFNPLTTSDADHVPDWFTLDLNGTYFAGKAGECFISLAHGKFNRTAASDVDFTMRSGSNAYKQEMELYHCWYVGGPVANAGSHANSRLIVDGSEVTIQRGKLGVGPVLDINRWSGTGRTIITRENIAGELFEFTGNKYGITMGAVAGNGGSVSFHLGTNGHLFGASSGANTSLTASGESSFYLYGLGEEGKGLLSDGNSLKRIAMGTGMIHISGITQEDRTKHNTPAAGYAFVDVPSVTYSSPFALQIIHNVKDNTTVDTLNIRDSSFTVPWHGTQIGLQISRYGGKGHCVLAPNMAFATGGIASVLIYDDSQANDTSATIKLKTPGAITIPADARLQVTSDTFEMGVFENVTDMTVEGMLYAVQQFTYEDPLTSGTPAAKLLGSLRVKGGGSATVVQQAGPATSPALLARGGTALDVAGAITVEPNGTLLVVKNQGSGDAVSAQSLQVGGTGVIRQVYGDAAIRTTGDVSTVSAGALTVAIQRPASATATAPVVACNNFTMDQGTTFTMTNTNQYVQQGHIVQASGAASIDGTATITMTGFNIGAGLHAQGNLDVGATGTLAMNLFRAEGEYGGIYAAGNATIDGNVDLEMGASNMSNRTPGFWTVGTLTVSSTGRMTCEYTGYTNNINSGGAGVKAYDVICDGSIELVHKSGGRYVEGVGDIYAMEVSRLTTIGANGLISIRREGGDVALGTGQSNGHGLYSPQIEVNSNAQYKGLYVYANRQVASAIVAPTSVKIGVGGYLHAEKAADSAATGAAIDCGTTEVAGTLRALTSNGQGGLVGNSLPLQVNGTGLVDIDIAGTGAGHALYKFTVTIERGGRVTVDQAGGSHAVYLGSGVTGQNGLGRGSLTVEGALTINRSGTVTGHALLGGKIIIGGVGGSMIMDLKAGDAGIFEVGAGMGTHNVQVGGGATLEITQHENSLGEAMYTSQLWVSGESRVRINQLAAAKGKHALNLRQNLRLDRGADVEINQSAPDSDDAVSISNGGVTLYAAKPFVINKTGGTGNALQANMIQMGDSYSVGLNIGTELVINQSAGSDSIVLTGNSHLLQINPRTVLRVEKTGGTGGVLSGDDMMLASVDGNGCTILVNQSAGEEMIVTDSFEVVDAVRLELKRTSTDTNPVFRVKSGGGVRIKHPVYAEISNDIGPMVRGQGAAGFTLQATTLNYKQDGANEAVWNNGWGRTATDTTGVAVSFNSTMITGISWAGDPLLDNRGIAPNATQLTPQTFDVTSNVFSYLRAGTFDSFTIDTPLKQQTGVAGTLGANGVGGQVWEYLIPQDGTLTLGQGPVPFTGTGAYSVTMPSALSDNRSRVYVMAEAANGLKAFEYADVKGWVSLDADQTLNFKDTNVSYAGLVSREDASVDWEMSVFDNRGYMNGSTWVGSPWRVSMKVDGNFTNENAPYDELTGSYMFLRRNGFSDMQVSTVDATLHNATSGMPNQATRQMDFSWPADQGLLFQQAFTDGQVGGEYSANIIWTITY